MSICGPGVCYGMTEDQYMSGYFGSRLTTHVVLYSLRLNARPLVRPKIKYIIDLGATAVVSNLLCRPCWSLAVKLSLSRQDSDDDEWRSH